MKVTLDLARLLQDGKITQQEHDKLLQFSKRETKSHAFSIIMILAIISVGVGLIGLFPEFFRSVRDPLLQLLGARGIHFFAIVMTGAGALMFGSGFLATLCAFTVLTFVGNEGTFYTHPSYFIFIEEPGTSVIIFSVLAYISFLISKRLNLKQGRAALVFSRACIFIVNLAFWIGSVWGHKNGYLKMPDLAFGISWAIALLAIGIWGSLSGRRWVVNIAAIFGSIHFFTQWFERLGASPGSLVCAGVIALLILYGIRKYNQSFDRPITQLGKVLTLAFGISVLMSDRIFAETQADKARDVSTFYDGDFEQIGSLMERTPAVRDDVKKITDPKARNMVLAMLDMDSMLKQQWNTKGKVRLVNVNGNYVIELASNGASIGHAIVFTKPEPPQSLTFHLHVISSSPRSKLGIYFKDSFFSWVDLSDGQNDRDVSVLLLGNPLLDPQGPAGFRPNGNFDFRLTGGDAIVQLDNLRINY